MSFVWTLRRWIDPQQAADEAARKRQMDLPLLVTAEGGAGDAPVRVAERPSVLFECRVCGLRAHDCELCPRCLAGTMRRV